MGSFETLSDGIDSVQVKCYQGSCTTYHIGDKVPLLHHYDNYEEWPKEKQIETYTIVLPSYEKWRFVLIKERVFVGFTNEVKETWKPFVAKWGEKLDKLSDFTDFFSDLVESIKSEFTSDK